MTEVEWLLCADPRPMLGAVKNGATERKVRLFALSCCCCTEFCVTDDVKRCRRAIAALESRIEGAVDEHDFQAALDDASGDGYGAVRYPGDTIGYAISAAAGDFWCLLRCNWEGLVTVAGEVFAYDALTRSRSPELERIVAFWRVKNSGQGDARWSSDEDAVRGLPEFVSAMGMARSNQANLLRDIFGNPFRPVTCSPRWRTNTVLAIARQMYESRDFSPMSILADALQDAECDDLDVLNHCRGPGPHARGCWVVDLLLGKE